MTQPDALRLADSISRIDTLTEHQRLELLQASAELRRLYRVSEELRESLNHKSYYQARLSKHMREMKVQHDELLAALERSRAQWIHSVNADYCLAAIEKAQQ